MEIQFEAGVVQATEVKVWNRNIFEPTNILIYIYIYITVLFYYGF